MKILTRYVLFELLQVFLLTLAGLTALIFIGLIGKEAVSKALGLGPLLRMAPYLLPQAMQFAVPGTMLLATTSVYGRLSASNEIVAAKSMGISPWALALPTIILAGITSFGAVALNDLAVSWGRMGVQRVFVESLEQVIYGQLRLHRTFASGGVQITVRRVEGSRLIWPTLTVQGKEGEAPWTVSAASAELKSAPDRHKLIVSFEEVEVSGPAQWNGIDPEKNTHEIDLDELLGAGGRSASTYALSEIDSAIRESSANLTNLHRTEQTEIAFAMMTGDFDRIGAETWGELQRKVGGTEYHRRRLSVEPYRRWANGFSCLCFVLVGVPMSIIRQKGEFLASFFMCFLPILLAYYPMLMLSVDHAKGGDVPPIAVWIGNIVLAIWGLAMMRRVVRH